MSIAMSSLEETISREVMKYGLSEVLRAVAEVTAARASAKGGDEKRVLDQVFYEIHSAVETLDDGGICD